MIQTGSNTPFRPPIEDWPPFTQDSNTYTGWKTSWIRWLNNITTSLMSLLKSATSSSTTALSALTSATVTHNLNTKSVVVQAYDSAGLLVTPTSVQVTGVNTVMITFGSAFTGNVVVVG